MEFFSLYLVGIERTDKREKMIEIALFRWFVSLSFSLLFIRSRIAIYIDSFVSSETLKIKMSLILVWRGSKHFLTNDKVWESWLEEEFLYDLKVWGNLESLRAFGKA